MLERSKTWQYGRARRVVEGRAGVAGTPAERHHCVRPGKMMAEEKGEDSEERELVISTLGVAFRKEGDCHVDRVPRSPPSNLAMRRSLRTAAGGPAPRNHGASPA